MANFLPGGEIEIVRIGILWNILLLKKSKAKFWIIVKEPACFDLAHLKILAQKTEGLTQKTF